MTRSIVFRRHILLPRVNACRIVLESARKTAQWFLNRPGVKELREADRKFYTALASERAQPQSSACSAQHRPCNINEYKPNDPDAGSRCCPCRASSAACPWCHPGARPLWRSTPVSVWAFGIGPALSQAGHLKVEARSELFTGCRGDCFLLRLLEAACRGNIVSRCFEAWPG